MPCWSTDAIVPPAVFSQQITEGDDVVYRSLPGAAPLDAMTLVGSLARTARQFPHAPFLGHRPIDTRGVAGPFQWQTYSECYARVQAIAAGLVHHEMLEPTDDGHKFLGIYMKNRPEWVLSQYAAFFAGATVVPIYDTLGATSTEFILNETRLSTVVCTSAELEALIQRAPRCPHLRHIVVCDVVALSLVEIAAARDLQLWTLTQLETHGQNQPIDSTALSVEAMAMLMYTSGTTGDPKGVPMTHGNLNAVRHGILDRLRSSPRLTAVMNSHPSGLSFLPLAHVAEQGMHTSMIYIGGAIGFYQGDALKLLDDVQALRPTIFLSVPRLLNKIYDKVMEGALAAGGLKAWLFQTALDTKLANLSQGYQTHSLFDALVFTKLKAALGLDRCEILLTGAAPLSATVLSFYRVVLGCTCLELYGQTETGGAATMTDLRELDAGSVGPPMVSTEIKLVSVPDMKYNVTDTVHGQGDAAIAVKGRGEVCFRGPTVFSGYFKAPEKTAEVLDEDGWLHSGDIGVWTLDGRLKLVDRKKNIFKLAQGEYVAPEKIENVLQTSPLVAQAFVHGDSLHASLVAIIVPEETALAPLAATLKVSGAFLDWCNSPAVTKAVLTDLQRVGRENGLLGFELVRAIALDPNPFTVENDLLTPTFKLKRHDAQRAFASRIEALYASGVSVVAGHAAKL
ncbi:hypothetical protein SPRG_19176 [Saprolegnia parasitica CBS 223.65]|uniref:AMP-dependent synthetase/ligase domain-containing protein n=1 Tax=Saprolegnia parasitica (strain CBS 223.65) TaxID=695850 RepID=A0A067D3D8_SAPPC|nr:hypothetical protein SPRG_19176 [Saprolegnia parasitica CBS 223.65]KDO33542.1 hypothetical protein SPRG_19176 [Saprolegnia parasitica CBS 223.65]|eukprot:XP_012195602.1 hypothetical protein SPRG_19176 [Saprolegnia parasitica CBS 223.65]